MTSPTPTARMKLTDCMRPTVNDRDCPARLILDHLADKWAVLIVVRLASGTLRFAELRRAIDGINSAEILRARERFDKRNSMVVRAER